MKYQIIVQQNGNTVKIYYYWFPPCVGDNIQIDGESFTVKGRYLPTSDDSTVIMIEI